MRNAGLGDLDTTVTSHHMEHQLDGCDPLACVLYSHSPSVQVYYALRTRLESSSDAWLQEFVALDGLDSLLDSLGHMIGPKFCGFSDAILQIDCLSCIRAVLNSRVGMDLLVNSQDCIFKLLKGMDLANTLPRKHVLELLSAVCVYNKLAHRRMLDALDKFKQTKHLFHRFSFVVNELKLAETIPHKTSVLTFINAIICSTSDRTQRCRIRNEFIGLTLLDVLSFLQREDTDEDLYTQLQVFTDKKHEDETFIDLNSNLDLSDPHDLADAIQTRVFGGPKMVSFVNILQDLLAIELQEKEKSENLWQLLERHTHHLVHGTLDINSLSVMDPNTTCQAVTAAVELSNCHRPSSNNSCEKKPISGSAGVRKEGAGLKTSADSGYLGCEEKLSPPSYNTDGGTTFNYQTVSPSCNRPGKQQVSSIKRDRTTGQSNVRRNLGQMSMYDNMSPFKLPPRQSGVSPHVRKNSKHLNSTAFQDVRHDTKQTVIGKRIPSKTNLQTEDEPSQTEQSNPSQVHPNYMMFHRNKMAYPANSMKNLKWIKLDDSVINIFQTSLWAHCDASKSKIQPDFQQVEEMFREKYSKIDDAETPLLSDKTRISMNLFLNRLDEEPSVLVKRLFCVDGPGLPLPSIKHLVDILPDHDEIKHLKYFNGNPLSLGQAEQFVLHLSDHPDYRILLAGHLRKAEFSVTAPQLGGVLSSMLESSRLILGNDGLKEIFILILRIGNFLNHGQFNGYASGYKLNTLTRLADVKSREPGHHLVHFLVHLADTTDEQLLAFLSEIPRLDRAASCSPAQIKSDFDKMNAQINGFVRQLACASQEIKEGFDGFLEEVKREFRDLQAQITDLKFQSQRLAEFFCEGESFDIQNCFSILLDFFKQMRLCRQEVQLMRKQKSVAVKHSDMLGQQIRNKHLALKFGQDAGANSSMVEEKRPVIDTLLTELHRGNFRPTIAPPSQPTPGPADVAKKSPKPRTFPNTSTTPDRDLNTMELSHISLMGTPMLNRPSSEIYDGELTITALSVAPKVVTSSVKHLPDGLDAQESEMNKAQPVFAIQKPVTRTASSHSRNHHRSRSDLAESINITKKWIRYQEQVRQDNFLVPLARPESSMTLATLNLESGSKRFPYQQPIALVSGPTIELPALGEHDLDPDIGSGEFIRTGKKGERKSGTFSNFFNKISKKVLKQRNSGDHPPVAKNCAGEGGNPSENMRGKSDIKSQTKFYKGIPVTTPSLLRKVGDKENVCQENACQEMAFDRGQKKNAARLSNRFKVKSVK